ncbi:MAG: restriction endonuclease subunit S [Flavobacterium sp.]|nr:restriction endonuclease subunit S [Flavobacterium sp.]
MKKYDQYKNSGVEWLGEIPEHWEALSNKYIFKLNKNLVGKKSSEYDLLSLTLNGVIKRDMENPSGKFPAEFDTYQEVKKGDFIFCLFDVEETPRTVGLSDFDGMITGAYTVMQVDTGFNKSFLYYFYLNLDANKRMKPLYTGLRNTISKDNFFSFKTFVPPLKEQAAIANFLDDKTTKIDQAIAIKQKQIELLKERRQILIHKAVTRGLYENVKLKDSGVEWIGEIPKHWEVKKLYGLCNFIRGNSTFSKDELLSNGNYVALQYGKTYKVDEINDSYSFYVNDEFYKETQVVKHEDTILISTSETIEDLGHSAYYNRNDIGLIGGEQILLNPNKKKVNGHYLYFYSKLFSKELRKYATGIKVFRFNVNNLKTIYISIPSLTEQAEIAQFIETATTKIATAISLKEQEIDKLKEYKMSLIDGVVTGKVKVC